MYPAYHQASLTWLKMQTSHNIDNQIQLFKFLNDPPWTRIFILCLYQWYALPTKPGAWWEVGTYLNGTSPHSYLHGAQTSVPSPTYSLQIPCHRQLHREQLHEETVMSSYCFRGVSSYHLLNKASHLTAFCSWDSRPHLPITTNPVGEMWFIDCS